LYNTFFLPTEKSIKIIGYDDLMNPDYKWTLGQKLVFNQWYKRWLKARRTRYEKLRGTPNVEEKQYRSLEWMITNGKYPVKDFIDIIEYRLRTDQKVSDEEMKLYRKLKSNSEGSE
jgi:hypothetical protein